MILFHCPGSKILDDLGPILFAHAVRAWANVIITQDIAQNVSKSKFGASRVALYRPVGHSLPSTCCTQSTQSRSILLFSLFVTLSVSTEQQSCCLTRFVSFVQHEFDIIWNKNNTKNFFSIYEIKHVWIPLLPHFFNIICGRRRGNNNICIKTCTNKVITVVVTYLLGIFLFYFIKTRGLTAPL